MTAPSIRPYFTKHHMLEPIHLLSTFRSMIVKHFQIQVCVVKPDPYELTSVKIGQ